MRQSMKNCLEKIPPGQFRSAGISAAKIIRPTQIWQKYKTVLLFMSTKNEIDTTPLLNAALEDQKNVFVPKVEKSKSGKKMNFYRITANDVRNPGFWQKGSFGIMEPGVIIREQRTESRLRIEDLPALIFMPGLAFDHSGNRLGKGGGFYDRFLAELQGYDFLTAGLCLDAQLVQTVPVAPWDQKVNCVLTERELRIF